MRLDHLSYAVAPEELASTVGRLGQLLGAAFRDGGVHPRFGTRNFVLPVTGGGYLEVVAPLDHPAADQAPFGRAVRARAVAGGGWLGWVVGVDDLGPVEARLGRPAADGHRVRPDGFDLRWRQIGVLDLLADPQLPFFVQWLVEEAQRPSAAPAALPRLVGLEVCGDAAAVGDWLGVLEGEPLEGVAVRWLPGAEHGVVAAEFETAHGRVRVD